MVTFSIKSRFCHEGIHDFPAGILYAILLAVFGQTFFFGGRSYSHAKVATIPVAIRVPSPFAPPSTHANHRTSAVPASHPSQVRLDEIADIISRLGDPSYVVRNDAELELLQIGGPAIEPLTKLLTHRDSRTPDSEVLLRASRLLILIERADHARQIREFLNGKDNDCRLAGWPHFTKIVGSDESARKLFVGMHEAQSGLMSATDKGLNATEESFQQVAKRSLRIGSIRNASHSLGTLSSALFVSSIQFESETGLPASRIQYSDVDLRRIGAVLDQPQMITFINRSGSKLQIVQLISHWLDSLAEDDVQSVTVKLSVITAYQLKNKLDWVMTILSQRTLPSQTRVFAMQVISQLGDEKRVPMLEKLFDDRTQVGSYLPRRLNNSLVANKKIGTRTNQKLLKVRFCDVALATAIILRRENLTEFGFSSSALVGKRLVPDQAGFLTDQARRSAFEEWDRQTADPKPVTAETGK